MGISRYGGKESGMTRARTAADLLGLAQRTLGQHCPTHYPGVPEALGCPTAATSPASRLGAPIDIRQVAALLGCSPWSIRNTWIPKGLPCLRSGASSKLIFFTDQVIRWIERQQQGGRIR